MYCDFVINKCALILRTHSPFALITHAIVLDKNKQSITYHPVLRHSFSIIVFFIGNAIAMNPYPDHFFSFLFGWFSWYISVLLSTMMSRFPFCFQFHTPFHVFVPIMQEGDVSWWAIPAFRLCSFCYKSFSSVEFLLSFTDSIVHTAHMVRSFLLSLLLLA